MFFHVKKVWLACHLSSKVDSARQAGSTGGVQDPSVGHSGPALAYFGPLSGPRTCGASVNSTVTTDGNRRGVQAPEGPLNGRLTQGYPPTPVARGSGLGNTELRTTGGVCGSGGQNGPS